MEGRAVVAVDSDDPASCAQDRVDEVDLALFASVSQHLFYDSEGIIW
jgi:hypothetical protein